MQAKDDLPACLSWQAGAGQSKAKVNSNFEDKFKTLFSLSSPYEIKNGIRFLRGTNNLVSEGLKIIAIDISNNNSISVFSSISECSIAINIDRLKKLNNVYSSLPGQWRVKIYKNFKFLIATPPSTTKIKKKSNY
jgi:hypothetical protein